MRKNKCHVCMSNRKITCEEKDCIPALPSTAWCKSPIETFYGPQTCLGHIQGVKARGCQSSMSSTGKGRLRMAAEIATYW